MSGIRGVVHLWMQVLPDGFQAGGRCFSGFPECCVGLLVVHLAAVYAMSCSCLVRDASFFLPSAAPS